MRTIAVINQKGGVGKTTTTVNLAAALARDGLRVLLIDLDPQSHATLHLGIELGTGDLSIYDVLVRGASMARAAQAVRPQLAVVPSHLDLVGAELELAGRPHRESVLAHSLGPFGDAYDLCLVDCPPSLGLLTLNALAAVREVLIPLQPHFLALQGLGRLLHTVQLARQSANPELRVTGVILCLYERGTRLAQEVSDDVSRFLAAASPVEPWHGARVLAAAIRRNVKLAECPSFGQTIFDYAPQSHGAEDYEALGREVRSLAPVTFAKTTSETPAPPAAAGTGVPRKDGRSSKRSRSTSRMTVVPAEDVLPPVQGANPRTEDLILPAKDAVGS